MVAACLAITVWTVVTIVLLWYSQLTILCAVDTQGYRFISVISTLTNIAICGAICHVSELHVLVCTHALRDARTNVAPANFRFTMSYYLAAMRHQFHGTRINSRADA